LENKIYPFDKYQILFLKNKLELNIYFILKNELMEIRGWTPDPKINAKIFENSQKYHKNIII
jgi:hypothetical protein